MSKKTKKDKELKINNTNLIEFELKAVTDGEIIKVEDIDDPVFSNKIIGDGYGIIPVGKKLYSPVSGKIEEMASTKHAVYLLTDDKFKLLIHIGVDTIELKGKGFQTELETGMLIKEGDLLVAFDPDFIREKGLNPVVSVIILDQKDRKMDLNVYLNKKAKANKSLALKGRIY